MNHTDHLVVFVLDSQRYALPLATVERTVRMVEITPLPQAPEIVVGIINLQGRVIPALNVRRRFRLPEREAGVGDQLIIARTARRTVALIIDEVREVTACPAAGPVAPDDIVPGLEHVAGVAKDPEGMILIHDLDNFLSLEEEKKLAAAIAPVEPPARDGI